MRPIALLVAATAVAVAAIVGVVLAVRGDDEPAYRGSAAPAGFRLPDFTLREVGGGRVDSRSLAGKGVAVTFLDAQCEDACPAIAAAVSRAFDLLDETDREQVVAVAISTDPAEDTPAEVTAFLRRNRAQGKLVYLGGTDSELRPLWREFGVLPSADTGSDSMHSAPVRIFDRQGRWVATQSVGFDLSPANLAHDLRAAAGS